MPTGARKDQIKSIYHVEFNSIMLWHCSPPWWFIFSRLLLWSLEWINHAGRLPGHERLFRRNNLTGKGILTSRSGSRYLDGSGSLIDITSIISPWLAFSLLDAANSQLTIQQATKLAFNLTAADYFGC